MKSFYVSRLAVVLLVVVVVCLSTPTSSAPSAPDNDNPCDVVRCGWGAACVLADNGRPTCQCNESCELRLKPVCGTDGLTYQNECKLNVKRCKAKSSIEIKKQGFCDEQTKQAFMKAWQKRQN